MGQFTDSDYSDPVKTLGKTYFVVNFIYNLNTLITAVTFISKCIKP